MHILLSNSQAGPGRTVKQEQEDISRNHAQAFIPGSVCTYDFTSKAVVELPKTNVTNNTTILQNLTKSACTPCIRFRDARFPAGGVVIRIFTPPRRRT